MRTICRPAGHSEAQGQTGNHHYCSAQSRIETWDRWQIDSELSAAMMVAGPEDLVCQETGLPVVDTFESSLLFRPSPGLAVDCKRDSRL